MRLKLPKTFKPDLEKFYASLSRPAYSKKDRYQDFKLVFGSEAGKRVLSEILTYCDRPTFEQDLDPNKLVYRAGMREIGLWIVRVLHQQPEEPK